MEPEPTQQRDSFEAPSSASSPSPIRLSLTDEDTTSLATEVECLQASSIICKIIGSRPSQGERRDLLQSSLLAEVGKLVDIQTLGHSFYQVELETPEAATRIIDLSPIAMQVARACVCPRVHGFDPVAEVSSAFIPREV